MKTTFFGPFIGEFGWEITYWHAWVRKMCRTKHKKDYKIVCSHPGHQLLYPDADLFIPLPETLRNLPARSYITDSWMNGVPKPHAEVDNQNYRSLVLKETQKLQESLNRQHMDCHYPWSFWDKGLYGVNWKVEPEVDSDFEPVRVPPEKQMFEKIVPTEESKKMLAKKVKPDQKLICIFPRCRKTRRPDKNWKKENYAELIENLKLEFPDCKIAIIGTPNGAYFADGVPKGCIDLINVEDEHRMDYEVAALNQSVLTIGSISGSILFALICGCPSLTWGHPGAFKKLVKEENPLGTVLTYYPEEQPYVEDIVRYAKYMMGGEKPKDLENKSILKLSIYQWAPKAITESKKLAEIKKKVIG